METSPIEIAFITGGFTIIGVLIGAWVAYRFALKLHNVGEFNKAAAKFRSSFIEAQRLLDQSKSFDISAPDGIRVKTILENHIVAHEKAMLIFRPYLHESDLASFDNTWKIYYSQENEYSDKLTDYNSKQCTSSVVDPKHENEVRSLALSRIENLLNFASYK